MEINYSVLSCPRVKFLSPPCQKKKKKTQVKERKHLRKTKQCCFGRGVAELMIEKGIYKMAV